MEYINVKRRIWKHGMEILLRNQTVSRIHHGIGIAPFLASQPAIGP
jgi:hypothetical protein